ncbi:MAG: 4-alpha-glucanotransferase [Gemmatimonadetes bacterium]|nr:4-alpha-glucanotransferase [Gemmatimonadota bacterium]
MRIESPLHLLADLVGIVTRYVDQTGEETRVTTDQTRVAILATLGIDASTADAAREALERIESREWERVLPPVRVVRQGDRAASEIQLHGPEDRGLLVEWSLEFTPETGESFQRSGLSQPQWNGTISLGIRDPMPIGYHKVRVTVRAAGEERSGEQSLIVVPDIFPSVAEVTGRERVFGLIANLYTLRSAANWGVGDLSDLGRLLEWAGEIGGAFVGVNPLHALRNQGADVSPYSPVSRIFRNPLYLDPRAVPEAGDSAHLRELLGSATVGDQLEELRGADRVDYDRVIALKLRVLRELHGAFTAAGESSQGERTQAYTEFLRAQGEPLRLFATFEALADHIGTGNWREWPEAYRNPGSPAVAEFQKSQAKEIEFHSWLQFELDRQLGDAAARGERAGLGIGLYQDLAIGTSPSGADIWANPHLFVEGVSIGAPPDDYSAAGQNWGLPPVNPWALRDDGYRYWIRLARASLRHSGALRIDHAMGLFQQFWIPEGMEGSQGAYMRFPAEDLLGILALEAHRHQAVVVGEDLGTVPPDVPPALRRWGVLSSRVLYFERDGDEYRAAAEYEPMSLATANTHDMPTLAGFWDGRDIEVKREVGMIESDKEAEEQSRTRVQERKALLRRLATDGALAKAEEPSSSAELRGAVHEFLCRTPAVMVGFSLDDVVGEVEPVNLPGVPPERFASWTRKLKTPVEALASDPDVLATLRCGPRRD